MFAGADWWWISSRGADRSRLALSESVVETFHHFFDLPADLRTCPRPQAVDRIRALNDHVVLPDAFATVGRGRLSDRVESKGLSEELRRRIRCDRLTGNTCRHDCNSAPQAMAFSPACAESGPRTETMGGPGFRLKATLTAALTAARSPLVLRLVDLELAAIHLLAIQALDRTRGVAA